MICMYETNSKFEFLEGVLQEKMKNEVKFYQITSDQNEYIH